MASSAWGRRAIVAGVLVGIAASELGAAVIYVRRAATGANNGTSWADAFNDLADGIAVANAGDEIWITKGGYRPDLSSSPLNPDPPQVGQRFETFEIKKSIRIYGGFDGTESTLEERAGLFHQTLLNGDLNGDDSAGTMIDDNSWHVVTVTASNVVIDGVTIVGGHNGPNSGQGGAGVLVVNAVNSVVYRNVSFRDHTAVGPQFFSALFTGGGAVLLRGGTHAFIDCLFVNNRMGSGQNRPAQGGAVRSAPAADVSFTSCVFVGNSTFDANTTKLSYGGAIFAQGSLRVDQCVFVGNRANSTNVARGGAIHAVDADIQQSTFIANSVVTHDDGNALLEGAALHLSRPAEIGNSIFWNNRILPAAPVILPGQLVDEQFAGDGDLTFRHSIIQGWIPTFGDTNSGQDPVVADLAGVDGIVGTDDDDVRLTAGSPAVDAGGVAYVPVDHDDLDGDGDTTEPLPLDVDRRSRRFDLLSEANSGSGPAPAVDIGAYEYHGDLCQPDLGFGGDGTLAMEICGDDPTTAGSLATLQVTGAQPASLLLLFVSTTANPTPIPGGTLVTVPPLATVAFTASPDGVALLPVFGGPATPITLVVQLVEPGVPDVSNAVELTIGL